MEQKITLAQIREKERKSHIEAYSGNELYVQGSWLEKPVKTVLDLLPCFEGREQMYILDLGCGVGRNCIAIAQHFQGIPCTIDCVDILDFSIEKLKENAEKYHVTEAIRPTAASIEEFSIARNHYHWIIAVSALEHVDSVESFTQKLFEIRDGIQKNGIVCLILNSNVKEYDSVTGTPLPPQFEVNLPTEALQTLLSQVFAGWEVLKSNVRMQCYDIPREHGISDLHSHVVTFAARK